MNSSLKEASAFGRRPSVGHQRRAIYSDTTNCHHFLGQQSLEIQYRSTHIFAREAASCAAPKGPLMSLQMRSRLEADSVHCRFAPQRRILNALD